MREPLQWFHVEDVRPEHVAVRPNAYLPGRTVVSFGAFNWQGTVAEIRAVTAEIDRQIRPSRAEVMAMHDRFDRLVAANVRRPDALRLATLVAA